MDVKTNHPTLIINYADIREKEEERKNGTEVTRTEYDEKLFFFLVEY